MSNTLYRFVKASERLPETDGMYYCRFSTNGLEVRKEIIRFSDLVFWDSPEIITEQYSLEEIEWLCKVEADQHELWIKLIETLSESLSEELMAISDIEEAQKHFQLIPKQ